MSGRLRVSCGWGGWERGTGGTTSARPPTPSAHHTPQLAFWNPVSLKFCSIKLTLYDFGDKIVINYVEKYNSDKQLLYD